MALETQLSERLREKIKELDTHAKELVTNFRLRDFTEYRYSAGYCQALSDISTLMDEILTDLQKE